jgi:hypothetical protein
MQLREHARFHSRDNRLKDEPPPAIAPATLSAISASGEGRMLSRALILATVMLWIGTFAAEWALAQENLEAGKSPSQIFAGTCNACHKGPRGLLRTVPAGSLSSFLRQHYTTSPNMANVLAAYLVSNGANDPKAAAAAAKGAKEGTKEAKQEARPASAPVEQLDRFGRKQHPTTAAAAPQENASPAGDKPPDMQQPGGRWSAKQQKLTKRGRPVEELPKEEPAASEPPKSETATVEPGKPEGATPSSDSPSQSVKIEEGPAVRPDPDAPVTPAPAASPVAALPATAPTTSTAAPAPQASPSSPATPPTVSAAAAPSSGGSEPLPVMALPPAAPAIRASAPSLPPVPPAGPPAPPISQ